MTDLVFPKQWAGSLLAVLLGAVLLLALSCQPEIEYEQVNQDSDCLTVRIEPPVFQDDDDSTGDDDDSAGDDDDSASGSEEAAEDIATINLLSRAGVFATELIGSATVSPTIGPAGTRFTVVVVLDDTGTTDGNPVEVITRATLKVDNGDIIVNEFDMSESPADESRWGITVEAGGDRSTTIRDDLLCVALYTTTE